MYIVCIYTVRVREVVPRTHTIQDERRYHASQQSVARTRIYTFDYNNNI